MHPSKFILHSSGLVTFAPDSASAPAAGGSNGQARPDADAASNGATAEELQYYLSPEEQAGGPRHPRSHMYSLGILFFELFHNTTTSATLPRARLLQNVHQRIFPQAFLNQEAEVSFLMPLLQPDPQERPTLDKLVKSKTAAPIMEQLQERYKRRLRQQRQQVSCAASWGSSATLSALTRGNGKQCFVLMDRH